ncbi:cytochrome P450 [Mycena leptocephala]|nr:cytochrome P450 [Mycena leptocephala]
MNYGVASGALVAFLVGYFVLSRRSTIRNITGPPSQSWIFGHMLQLMLSPAYGDHEFKWLKTHGPGLSAERMLRGLSPSDATFLGLIRSPGRPPYGCRSPRITVDFEQPRISHYRPPFKAWWVWCLGTEVSWGPEARFMQMLIYYVDSATGETHKRLRNEFNMGFTAARVRSYHPIFEKVAQAITQGLETSETSSINIVPLLTTATLSAIAEAALSYSMDDLGDEYVAANAEITAAVSNHSPGQIADALGICLPTWLSRAATHLPMKTFKAARRANYLGHRLGEQVVQRKKDLAQRGLDIDGDIFGMLVDGDRSDATRNALTAQEIISQTQIILSAGQDTTTNTIAFGLLELAKNIKFQEMLRAEIDSILGAACPGNVAYDRMPLLNAFIRETLRFYPAETITERIALQDTVIPLSESIITSTGKQISDVSVRKGQIVVVGIASYNRLESRWGDDAHEFRPSRWLEGTISKGEPIGPYANLLTFLGGPHTCLGWRFAISEMQVVICELVGKFSFALPDNDPVRVRIVLNTLQPTMSNGKNGVPLRVTRIL